MYLVSIQKISMWKHINMFTVIEKDLLTITFCELLKALFNES